QGQVQGGLRGRSHLGAAPDRRARQVDRPEPVAQRLHEGQLGQAAQRHLRQRLEDGAQDHLLPAHAGGVADREEHARRRQVRLHPEAPAGRGSDRGSGCRGEHQRGSVAGRSGRVAGRCLGADGLRRRRRHGRRGGGVAADRQRGLRQRADGRRPAQALPHRRSGLRGLPVTIINSSKTDPNKILPIRYNWAREYYKSGVANNWTPEEVSMQKDVEQWKAPGFLAPTERRLILWNLGFFSTAESLTANNIVLAVYHHITNPESRQYLLRQAFEEAIHTDTFIYCCDSLGLDPDEIFNMYKTIPSIAEKDAFVVDLTRTVFDPTFKTEGIENIRLFVRDLVGYYVIMEGIFFYAGFAMMLALKRQNKMVGIGEQFEYIMRDESLHLAFGCDLINTIRAE